jgi:glycine/D-amino acid oxidase-like deaminating enzyme
MSRREHDVAIIGNGAVGCALALRLTAKHPDTRVALLGPSLRPESASLAAGAMLGAFAELDAGALDFPLARRKFEAALDASRMWDAHLELLNSRLDAVAPVEINKGTHVVSNPSAGPLDEENVDAIVGYLREFNEPFREVDPRDIDGVAPVALRPRRAIYIENEGTVSARHLHRAYDEAFSRAPGVDVIDAAVASIDATGTTTRVTTAAGDTFSARHVVIAAGVGTQRFVEQLGLKHRIPRIVYGVGVALVLRVHGRGPTKVFRSPSRGLACGVYAVPYEGDYCYLGATSQLSASEAPRPRVQALHDLLRAGIEQVNPELARAEIHKVLVGYRPTTMDTFPVFGRTSIDGVWIASGTKRDGFHLSPKSADELVTALDTNTQPFSGAFVPERRLILEMPIQRAIDRAVAQLVAASPREEPLAEPEARARVLDAYVRSGLANQERGIPAELLEMYRGGYADWNLETFRQ